jgi:hypothetical protein
VKCRILCTRHILFTRQWTRQWTNTLYLKLSTPSFVWSPREEDAWLFDEADAQKTLDVAPIPAGYGKGKIERVT